MGADDAVRARVVTGGMGGMMMTDGFRGPWWVLGDGTERAETPEGEKERRGKEEEEEEEERWD
ncbi:hypothetical protein ACLOAV_004344 [Pseudogymnoascus australis]